MQLAISTGDGPFSCKKDAVFSLQKDGDVAYPLNSDGCILPMTSSPPLMTSDG